MPLVDLAIPASGPPAARVRVTWWSARKVDPLNAWSERDWALMEESQPCGAVGREGRDEVERPVASSVSGAAASSLGAAEVRRLLLGDVSNVGWEIRADLACSSAARRALPSSGLSPLDSRDAIWMPPARCEVATVSELVDEVERLMGRGAHLLLNREVSEGFLCRRCGAELSAGPVDGRACERCGDLLVPVKPMTRLSRDTIGDLGEVCVGCLGVERDLLREVDRSGRARRWLEYCRRAP